MRPGLGWNDCCQALERQSAASHDRVRPVEALRVALPRQEGRARRGLLGGHGQAAARGAPGGRRGRQPRQGGDRGAARRRRSAASRGRALAAELAGDPLDVTLPGRAAAPRATCTRSRGRWTEIVRDLPRLGFDVATGPGDRDRLPQLRGAQHPAGSPRARHAGHLLRRRDLVEGAGRPVLLRTHTSPVQIRTMLAQPPPVRIVAPGQGLPARRRRHPHADVPPDRGAARRRGRSRSPTSRARSTPSCTGVLRRRARRRASGPSYFPFTEPSAEVDVELRRSAAARAAASASRPAGSRSSAPGWCTRTCFAPVGYDPAKRHRLRLRHGRRAHRDAPLRRRRPAHASSRTTSASWSSSEP